VPNILHVTVENPDEILNAGAYGAGALIQLQSAATETGAFADLTGTGSTPTIPIVTATNVYTGYDPAGTSTTWYRTRYKSADGARLSDWQAAFQVGREGVGGVCSLDDAKQRLGFTTTTEDENILGYIAQATDFLQRETGRLFVRSPLAGTATFLYNVSEATRTLRIERGIASVTTLEVKTSTTSAFVTVPTTDWFLDPSPVGPGWTYTRIVISDQPTGSIPCFYPGRAVVRMTGAEGWATVPASVENAGLDYVEMLHRSRGNPGVGSTFTVNVDGSRTYERLPASVWGVIKAYGRPAT
jgi:hypothetical protein